MVMKVFFALLVLIFSFQSWTKADDIRDFEIEGMSIGDSLLDYFSEKKIIENKLNYNYGKKGFYASGFYKERFYETYDSVEIHLKDNDKNYIIYSLDGLIFYDEDIKKCHKKQNEIKIELLKTFENSKMIDSGIQELNADKSGNSTLKTYYWRLNAGNLVGLECYNWSDKIVEESSWKDNLRISLVNKEFNDWLP
jgi:hypothetical protein